ncbi:IS66 family insertion sequence element accessory protein TnpB [Leptospira noguchii]|uniref:IS66 family insertion sequence element accessory protein TnpB n=1 Tax=Leptospira noguchii TaxID=28182 RepID=UPI0002FD00D5|nr:IS66 family insertion sequence element accessory protein TnpB [Leptospira noguchii]AGS80609.1 IS66 family element, Orf2 protein [Leptospira phage vB_LnoZ_CZ214-LE1]
MELNPGNRKVYLRPGATDLRKSINTLTVIVEGKMKKDPYSESVFLFCNRKKDKLKMLYWDKSGFCLWQKRLEESKFPWPNSEEEVHKIPVERFHWLLNGIDFFKEHKKLKYKHVS